ncbi:MAG: hypothetical protein IJS54_04860 [Desulfovibrio sp.]|nr:hypothetical protein [Desulfovibrio sp.]
MKDERGLYYFPNPTDHTIRTYVRRSATGDIEFRLWKDNMPEVWEKHPWITHDVVRRANDLYHKERDAKADALHIYDASIAKVLLAEESS